MYTFIKIMATKIANHATRVSNDVGLVGVGRVDGREAFGARRAGSGVVV